MVTPKIGRKVASKWQLHLHFWVKRKCPVTACSAISACGKAQHWEKSLEIYQTWERENRKQLSKPASLGRQEMQFTNFNACTFLRNALYLCPICPIKPISHVVFLYGKVQVANELISKSKFTQAAMSFLGMNTNGSMQNGI